MSEENAPDMLVIPLICTIICTKKIEYVIEKAKNSENKYNRKNIYGNVGLEDLYGHGWIIYSLTRSSPIQSESTQSTSCDHVLLPSFKFTTVAFLGYGGIHYKELERVAKEQPVVMTKREMARPLRSRFWSLASLPATAVKGISSFAYKTF